MAFAPSSLILANNFLPVNWALGLLQGLEFMGYIVGFLFVWFGIFTLKEDHSSYIAWSVLVLGIFALTFTVTRPKKTIRKGKGDGYRSSTADYTNGGSDSSGGGGE